MYTGRIPLSDSSVNHIVPSSRRVPQHIFFIPRATPFVPIVESISTCHNSKVIVNCLSLMQHILI